MTSAFVNQVPFNTRLPCRQRRTCPTQLSSQTLSPQDKDYLNKVRERLIRSANRKATQNSQRHNVSRAYERPEDVSDEFLAAMRAFNAGQYGESVNLFAMAVQAAGGAATSRGGHVALWLAQAQDAAGDRRSAVAELEALQEHPDANIANTAAELLFIVTAPKLELPRDAFVELPELGRTEIIYGTHHLAASGLSRSVRMKKPIEKYSLEWYAKQPRPTREEREETKRDPAGLLLIAGGAAAALAFVLRSLPN